ncbi:MAG TPA: acyl-CoA dehydrogenase family protein, partial [Myxococcota bacterium]|nr:acyl-CoA dehydrogenase family protein [Myxococcota bacterium]
MKAAKKMAGQLLASPEQRMLMQTVSGFFKERGLERHRALRDAARGAGQAPSFSREDWRALGELGLLSVLVPEADGGMGLGLNEMALLCEAAGRVLAPEPLVGSAVWATSVLVSCGSEAQKAEWLPRMMCGEAVLAVAEEDRGARGGRSVAARMEGG